MHALDIYTTRQQWKFVLSDFPDHDAYHAYDYHLISKNNNEGEPLLLVVKDAGGKNLMCWPALKREIEGTDLFDLTSAYGHCGPLLNDYSIARPCFEFLFDALRREGCVSLFSRMHPVLVRNFQDDELQGIRLDGSAVVIDTHQQPEPVIKYRTNHRRDIRRAYEGGVKLFVDENCANMDSVIEIYNQAMRDVGAREYFMMRKEEIEILAGSDEFKSTFIFAQKDGENIGAAMFISTEHIMQYFIGGAVNKYKELSPLKVILSKAHEIAIDRGVRYFVLGGGVTGDAKGNSDNLFKFKKGFSDLEFPFHVFKRVIDPDAYERICALKGIDPATTDYFPAYRRPYEEGQSSDSDAGI